MKRMKYCVVLFLDHQDVHCCIEHYIYLLRTCLNLQKSFVSCPAKFIFEELKKNSSGRNTMTDYNTCDYPISYLS